MDILFSSAQKGMTLQIGDGELIAKRWHKCNKRF